MANPENRSPYEIFYKKIPETSPIPFLKPGYYQSKCTNKMGPKARECFYLRPARNHPRESKRMFVDTGRVVITRNVTWAHVPSGRFPAAQSKPSKEGEDDESDHEDREARSEARGSASGYEESEPDESEKDEIESSTIVTVALGRAPLPTSSTESGQGRVSYDPEGMMPSEEGLAKTSAATHREMRRLAEHNPGPQGSSL